MKKQILAFSVLGASMAMLAATASDDPVLMNIAGKNVRLSEFEYLYNKNNSQQAQPQSLDEYLTMFIDYKLKVADAEAAGIDTTQSFITEFTQFRNELADPYMVNKEVLDSLVRDVYSHMAEDIYVSHIMMRDDKAVFLDSLRTAIIDGKTTFEDAARTYSIDAPSAQRGGLMGWVVSGRYPWEFEVAAFETPVGEISPVVNSGFGRHIIRVEKRVPARGEVLVEHILRLTNNLPDSLQAVEHARIDSIYSAVVGGADFNQLASTFSQDPGSARRGGKLDWFGPGMMVQEFDSVAFALPVGAYSEPFRTSFGWHIIHKLDARGKESLEDARPAIEASLGSNERGQLPRRRFMFDMMKKYNGHVIMKNLEKVKKQADKMGGVLDSTMIATFAKSDMPIFEIDGVKYPLKDVIPAMSVSAVRGGQGISDLVRVAAINVMGEKALDLARRDLALVNPDYRNLVNEYRDGILLFEISNRNVWQRAAENKDELEKYFNENRSKYTWESPKFKSYIIFASNDSILGEAVNYASTLPQDIAPAEVVSSMRARFGRDVKIERVIAAKGENAITDFLAFGGDKPSSESARWPAYAAFRGRVIPAPEEAADVRGLVVADFQLELERRWIESLRAKYPVKVNQDVLRQVK